MKIMQNIFLSVLVILLIGCTSNDDKNNLIDECYKIDQSKIISEEELKLVCNSTSVYYHENELFLQCNCCLCLKFFPPANCDGVQACKDIDDCKDFFENAEYLFSMIED